MIPETIHIRQVGMHRAKIQTNIPALQQQDLIAEGLPILMANNKELLDAAVTMNGRYPSFNAAWYWDQSGRRVFWIVIDAISIRLA